MHHAIADGIALARLLLSLTDEGGQPLDFVPGGDGGAAPAGRLAGLAGGAARPARAAAGAARVAVHEGVETLLHPERLGPLARAAEVDLRAAFKLLAPGADPKTPLKGDVHVAHRVAWADPVPLSTVKRAGRAREATVNDVLVSAVAGAVGRHLRRTADEDIEEIHALVPFNLRPLDRPLPRDLGNRFGLILLGLPVGPMDPLARLLAVQERMGEVKRSHEGAIAYGILGLIGRTPAAVEARLVDFFSAKGTMVLTNVPGPRRPVSFAGTPVAGVLVWAPCSGDVGMSVSVFSYAGKVTVGFLTDAGLVPDPQGLADDFRREVLLLARHVRAAAQA
jgi:WS/DGAT/MGAT family acyltransferase